MRPIKNKGLLFILLLVATTAIVIPTINTRYIYPSFTRQLIEATANEAERTGSHLTRSLKNEITASIAKEKATHLFVEEVRLASKELQLMKIKLFSAEGKIV